MQSIFQSMMKVQKCMNQKCKKEVENLKKLQNKYQDLLLDIRRIMQERKPGYEKKLKVLSQKIKAQLKSIEASKEALEWSKCSAEKCQKENIENFKVLASHLKQQCAQDKKMCSLLEYTKQLISKKNITAEDIQTYKKRETSLIQT